MELLGTSFHKGIRGLGNLAGSFTKKPDAEIRDPLDVIIRSENGPEEKEWTVLVYAEGRHRLARSTDAAINKMEAAGSDGNVNVIVQATIDPEGRERFSSGMERVNTRRYFIAKDDDENEISSPVLGDLGKKVPLNAETLADFLSWGMKNFPAKHYMVIIKKHGLGFAKTDDFVPLSARELDKALEMAEQEAGRKVDLLSFDSCAMEQMETGYEVKEHAQVMTGSQEDVYASAFPYKTILSGLKDKAGTLTPEEAGKLVVEAHGTETPYSIHTAVSLDSLKKTGNAVKELVDAILREGVPRELLYTDLIRTSSMEPQESGRFAFNFRDMRGFLENIINDKGITSGEVKEKAQALENLLSDSIIAHHISNSKKKLKDGRGLNIFLPWKNPSKDLKDSYDSLKFQKDAGWMKLMDYIFEAGAHPSKEEAKPQAEHYSLAQKMGKAAIGAYKQYVSPYLLISCRHTPSCSQYGREAIEKHGLVQGGKMAFMRVLGCNRESMGKYDPVPEFLEDRGNAGSHHGHREIPPDFADNHLPELIINPPENVEKSGKRRRIENFLIGCGKIAGKVLGGLAGAIISMPMGIVLGATLGARAGWGTLEELNRKLLNKYHDDSVREFKKIENFVGSAGLYANSSIRNLTGRLTITEEAIERLKEKIPLKITDPLLKRLEGEVETGKLKALQALRNKRMLKETLSDALKRLSFSPEEAEPVINGAINKDEISRIDSLRSLINKKLPAKELEKELMALSFNGKEIDIILKEASHLENKSLASAIGAAAGVVGGIVTGALGAFYIGGKWGSRFGRLFAQNYVKDRLGELPRHYQTDQILQRYYR